MDSLSAWNDRDNVIHIVCMLVEAIKANSFYHSDRPSWATSFAPTAVSNLVDCYCIRDSGRTLAQSHWSAPAIYLTYPGVSANLLCTNTEFPQRHSACQWPTKALSKLLRLGTDLVLSSSDIAPCHEDRKWKFASRECHRRCRNPHMTG
jgi:hypothetical protein